MTIIERNKKYYIPPALYVRILKVQPLLEGSSPDGTNAEGEQPGDSGSDEDFPTPAKSGFFSFGYDDMNSDEQY